MAGYIGNKSSVTLVDGYNEAEADAEFVAITGDSMTGGLTITTADNTNQLTIVSTDADANAGPNLNFRRNSASPADGDLTGQFTFTNNNDAGEGTDYATMYTLSADVSNGSEDAAFYIKTMSTGTLRQRISLTDTATVFNEDSIDLDFRVESDNLTHALFVQGSDGNVGIGDSSPVSNNNFTALTITSTASTGGGQLYLKSSSVTGVVGADNATNAKLIVQTNTNHPIAFGTNNTERLRINTDGKVGVGTSSPSADFVVSNGGAAGIELQPEIATGTNRITNYDRAASAYMNFRLDALTHQFLTSGSERMRLDSSGNLNIGRTSTGAASDGTGGSGINITQTGAIEMARNGSPALFVNRTTSDGTIIDLRKNGTSVGAIGKSSAGFYVAGESGSDFGVVFDGGGLLPSNGNGSLRDNSDNLGHPSYRWEDAFITNGATTGSDANDKQDIATLTNTEMLVAARLSQTFRTYRWKDAVVSKGDSARTHTGTIAQEVQAAFTAEGLDAGDYAMFMSDTWWEHDVDVPAVAAVAEVTDEDGNVTTEAVEAKDAYTRTDTYDTEAEAPEGATSKTRMGIRYPELLSFVAAYNEQRFASIEARLTALEA